LIGYLDNFTINLITNQSKITMVLNSSFKHFSDNNDKKILVKRN
jgi:hypothetical protein